jgi:hypothetical protein
MDPSATHYEQVCQGLRPFFVCVIEEEDSSGNVGLLAHETALRHARRDDAQKRQQQARRNSKSWIAECLILPETEMEQTPVTAKELAALFNEMDSCPGDSCLQYRAKRRVAAWIKQQEDSLRF